VLSMPSRVALMLLSKRGLLWVPDPADSWYLTHARISQRVWAGRAVVLLGESLTWMCAKPPGSLLIYLLLPGLNLGAFLYTFPV